MGLLDRLKSAMNSMTSFSFDYREGVPALSPIREHGLDLGAMYPVESLINFPINALTMNLKPNEAAKMLSEWWGISDAESARATYRELFDGGSRTMYEMVEPAVAQILGSSRAEAKAQGTRIIDGLKANAAASGFSQDQIEAYYYGWISTRYLGLFDAIPASILAWDLARVVHISRMIVDAGYLGEEEAWAAIERASEMARENFGSWKEFGDNFIVGRGFWLCGLAGVKGSGAQQEKVQSSVKSFTDAVKILLTQEDSPWLKLAW